MNILRPDHAAYDVTAAWFEQTASSRSNTRRDDFYSALEPKTASSTPAPQEVPRRIEESDEEERARATRDAERQTGSAGDDESPREATHRDGRIECCFPFQDAYRRTTDGRSPGAAGADPHDESAAAVIDAPAEAKPEVDHRSKKRDGAIPTQSNGAEGRAAEPGATEPDATEPRGTEPGTNQASDAGGVSGPSSKEEGAAKEHQSDKPTPGESKVPDVVNLSGDGEVADANPAVTSRHAKEANSDPDAFSVRSDAGEAVRSDEPGDGGVATATQQVQKQTDPLAIAAAASIGNASVSANQAAHPDGTSGDARQDRGRRASRQVNDDGPTLAGERRRVGQTDGDAKSSFRQQLTTATREPGQAARADLAAPRAETNLVSSLATSSPLSTAATEAGLSAGLSADLTGSVGQSTSASSSATPTSSTSLGGSAAAVDASLSSTAPAASVRQRESSVTNEMRLNQSEQRRLMQRVSSAFRTIGAGEGEIRLRLSPPHLGTLRLEVKVKDQAMHARLQTETEAARHVLTENLSVLRDRLADQGIIIESFDIDVAQDGFEQSHGDSNDALQEQGRQLRNSDSPNHSGRHVGTEDLASEAGAAAEIDAHGHLNVVI